MLEILRAQKIARLVEAKFGKVSRAPVPIVPVTLTGYRTGSLGKNISPGGGSTHAQLLRDIDAEEGVLRTLSDAELDARYDALVEREQAQAKVRATLEEKGRPFNWPSASANFAYWSGADYWTLDEAVALLLGKAPDSVNWGTVEPYLHVSPFARTYGDLRRLALRATAFGQGNTIRPLDALRWAQRIGREVPHALSAACEARAVSPLPVSAADIEAERLRVLVDPPLLADEGGPERAALARRLGSTGAADAYLEERARLLASSGGVPPSNLTQAKPDTPARSGAPHAPVKHSTKEKRRDALDPAIELAQSKCKNAKDTAEVWGQLQALAQEERPPFLGVVRAGLKYTKHGDQAAHFTRGALDKRLHPEKRQKRR